MKRANGQECSKIVNDFLIYMTTIRGKSPRTRQEYRYDLLLFFRFLRAVQHDIALEQIQTVDVRDFGIEQVRDITLEDIYLFLEYCETDRGNGAASRARKGAAIKSFFQYLKAKRRLIAEDPAAELETPKAGKRTPIYMDFEEAKTFLAGIRRTCNYHRNYCIMMFFLNMGMRVSELCSLDMTSIQGQVVKIWGKGDKERTVFLNETCRAASETYMAKERHLVKNPSCDALFLSQRGNRLTRQAVADVVKKVNQSSGLNKQKLSPHKLRHTAATTMYKAGADIRSLQQILGHTSVSTTQIYTHVEDKEIKKVIQQNPFNQLDE